MSTPSGENKEAEISKISISNEQEPDVPCHQENDKQKSIVSINVDDSADVLVIRQKMKNGHVNTAYIPDKPVFPVSKLELVESEILTRKTRPPPNRQSFCQSMRQFALAMRPGLPYIMWLLFVVTGSCVFYLIETNVQLNRDSRIEGYDRCIGKTGFWGAVFYALSCCSTLGYGQVYPCTVATKVITVIYIIIGIPLTLVVLAKVGKWVCQKIAILYSKYLTLKKKALTKVKRNRSQRRRMSSNGDEKIVVSTTGIQIKVDDEKVQKIKSTDSSEDSEAEENEEIQDIPIIIGLVASLIFVLIGSIYYWVAEGYERYESFYYSFVMFLTGDLQITRFQYCIPIYICLFLGFGMVSTTVSIIVNNINNLVTRAKREVRLEMQQRKRKIARGEMVESLETDQEILKRILKKHGTKYLVALVSEEETKGIVKVIKDEVKQVKALKSNSKGCQTIFRLPETIQTQDGWSQDNPPTSENAGVSTENPEYSNMLVQAIPTVRDHQAQVRSLPRTASKSIDNTVKASHKNVQAYPDKQDLSTQYPKMSRLKPLESTSEEKREPIRQEKPVKLSTR